MYQEYCVHCIVIMNDGGWDRWGEVDSYQGVGGGDRGWVLSHSFFLFFIFCVLLSFGLSHPVFFLSE